MSDETKTNKNHPLFAENLRRAEDTLCGMANAVPDAVTDLWMQAAGFSALSGTKHGQRLVREVMRAALTHIAAPIVAEQWLIKAELENQRDARAAPPESQVRATCPSLPDAVPFFDEQLDVQALLAEVAQAHAQDRPCFGGQPQMIDRLAHIIRVYRGMETRDSSARIGVAPAGHSMETVTETSTWLALAAECDKRIDAGSVARWFRENGALDELPQKVADAMPRFCRWVVRKVAADMLSKIGKEIEDAHFVLTQNGAGLGNGLHSHEVQSKRPLGARIEQVVKQWNEMADENGKLFHLLTHAGVHSPRVKETDSLSVRLSALIGDLDGSMAKLDWPNNGTLIERISSLAHLFDSKDNALTSFWQDIRTIVGPVDVTDADREAVTEADAANGPDAREYYAERKALMRTVRENAEELKDIRRILTSAGFAIANGLVASIRTLAERNNQDVADKLLAFNNIQNILLANGWASSCEGSVESLRRLTTQHAESQQKTAQTRPVNEDAPLDDGESVETISGVWHSKYSNSYNRRLVELLSAYAYAGDADVRDVMNALPMPHVRARITALIHAIETLAIAHGMDVTDHLQ